MENVESEVPCVALGDESRLFHARDGDVGELLPGEGVAQDDDGDGEAGGKDGQQVDRQAEGRDGCGVASEVRLKGSWR